MVLDTGRSDRVWIIWGSNLWGSLRILRLQNKIKEKAIDPKDVSIIYVHPTDSGGDIISIPLDSDGDFLVSWPDGFFAERLVEKERGSR